jgi:hypothetical protein
MLRLSIEFPEVPWTLKGRTAPVAPRRHQRQKTRERVALPVSLSPKNVVPRRRSHAIHLSELCFRLRQKGRKTPR